MNETWKVSLETNDGEKKEFKALSCYELTEEQKCLWRTMVGEEKITASRIRVVRERKEKDESSSF